MLLSSAGMAELADVQDLGSCGEIRVGSTPTTRTKVRGIDKSVLRAFFLLSQSIGES